MARAIRSAPRLAVVEAPKQEGRSYGTYHRLMVVTTPPYSASTKQPKVPTARNEGTVLQDDKGKTTYTTSDINADNIAEVLDDSKSAREGVEERTTGDGDEQGQEGKKKRRSVAKAKRWTRIKTKGPSKVRPPSRKFDKRTVLADLSEQFGASSDKEPTAKQIEIGRRAKAKFDFTAAYRWR
jgi:hypothetical protein